jgi:membrane-associated phospholipid phosphatase
MLVVLAGGLGLGMIIFAAVLATIRPSPIVDAASRHRRATGFARLVELRTRLVRSIGGWGAFVVLLAAGYGLTFLIGWILGLGVTKLQDPVDWPVYQWVEAHRFVGEWNQVMSDVTQMGDRPITRAVGVVSAIGLAAIARRRRWIPALLLLVAFLAQYYTQEWLGDVVARPHPPTNDGTYPSGSALRIIAFDGFCAYLLYRYLRERKPAWFASPRRWHLGGVLCGFIAAAAFVEGYTRIDLLRHWITDVFGGWVVALGLLATFIYAAGAILPRPSTDPVMGTNGQSSARMSGSRATERLGR